MRRKHAVYPNVCALKVCTCVCLCADNIPISDWSGQQYTPTHTHTHPDLVMGGPHQVDTESSNLSTPKVHTYRRTYTLLHTVSRVYTCTRVRRRTQLAPTHRKQIPRLEDTSARKILDELLDLISSLALYFL